MTDFRRVIALGRSTLCLTLPKEWVQKNSVEKGSTLLVNENSTGALHISVDESQHKQEEVSQAIIHTDGKDKDTLRREIIAAYVQDHNEIVLVGKKIEEQMEDLKSILENLLALEIVSTTKQRVVTKVFLDATYTSLENVLRRLDMINRTLFDQTRKKMHGEKTDNAFSTLEEVDRLCYVALRSITRGFTHPAFAKQLRLSPVQLLFMWESIDRMKKIARRVASIRKIIESPSYKKLKDDEKEVLQSACLDLETLYRDTLMAYYKQDREISNALIEQHHNYRVRLAQLFSEGNEHISAFTELARRTSVVTEDIAIICMEQL